jgi:hypothetical protein
MSSHDRIGLTNLRIWKQWRRDKIDHDNDGDNDSDHHRCFLNSGAIEKYINEKKENESWLRVDVGDYEVLCCAWDAFVSEWMIVPSGDLFRPSTRIRWMSLIGVTDFRRFLWAILKILDRFMIRRMDNMYKIRLIIWMELWILRGIEVLNELNWSCKMMKDV